MLVEMSLAESLLNALAADKIHGVRMRRNFGANPSDEQLCIESLQRVIGKNIDGAKAAAREQARREVQEELSKAKRGEAYWEKRARELGAEDC